MTGAAGFPLELEAAASLLQIRRFDEVGQKFGS
jgi:hypothetical protein